MTVRTSFKGSFTALVTPFSNGALDEKAFRGLVDWQIAEGTSGLVPVGTTGESPTLSHDEHGQIVQWCIEQAKGRVPVIAGAGPNSTKEAIELAHNLGMTAVAEGVETEGVFNQLADLNCDAAQGYFSLRPQPAAGVRP